MKQFKSNLSRLFLLDRQAYTMPPEKRKQLEKFFEKILKTIKPDQAQIALTYRTRERDS